MSVRAHLALLLVLQRLFIVALRHLAQRLSARHLRTMQLFATVYSSSCTALLKFFFEW